MNLGITGRLAVVAASSRGLGRACATALAAEGCTVVINGRSEATLLATAEDIRRSTGATVVPVVGNLATESGRAALIEAGSGADILVTNNAGPAPGALDDWDGPAWTTAMENTFLPAALLIRDLAPGMRDRGFGRIVNITSAMVKSPAAVMGLSNAPRAALTALAKSVSLEFARHGVTVNNLLPYRIDTDRQAYFAERAADEQGISVAEARAEIERSVAAQRMGRPEEFGAICAFLCSTHAGFVSGQNIQVDGGSYVGLF